MFSLNFLQSAKEELVLLKQMQRAIAREIELVEQILAMGATTTNHAAIPKGADLKDTIETVLREEGKPIHYAEVYKRLLAKGVYVRGQAPVRNVGAHLSADLRFRSFGNGIWGLAEQSVSA